MSDNNERYNDAELNEFRDLIEKKITQSEEDLHLLREQFANDMNNGTDDTAPSFKSFEEGSETMSKEANAQLAARQERFLRDLKAALVRIENKTYGICRVTGKKIEYERLKLVPHATMSMEAKLRQK
ncbi:MAG: TraR/DksA family transcriptional regulator [Flavobacteriales bacterium]|jgi:RNA polymerase-binding transcription factor DksA|nr:TraR/DksA family transcriptional regulator [Flavobacteriales bacterium]MBT3572890.1 TraR/DksA family transcriptional regulator [Flavobacteriales bacterium]MBT3678436.1 TraR/DksA family transcriptional regulator [Flavobacteriales bacterium]MBT3740397.1 TraR/DksA family transcriptional regulator [Flavobacteriales bacterium]MBT4102815.1 TraR/DksA family transcriptional regulator [Flavobacteriales bacterium]